MICLLHPVAHAGADDGDVPAASRITHRMHGRTTARCRRRAIRWCGSSTASSAASSGSATAIATLLAHGAGAPRGCSSSASSASWSLSFVLVPFLGRNFFPVGRRRPDPAACARAGRHPHRGHRRAVRRHREGRSARSSRRTSSTTIVDNIGLPVSGINLTYNNTGGIGPQDGDIQIKLHRGPPADGATTSAQLRERAAARFPGTTFSFLPADIVSQILNFGAPAPIDVQVAGPNQAANYAYADKLLRRLRHDPRHRRRAHPAVARLPELRRRRRPHARAICRPDRARRDQQPGRQPGRQQPGRADLLAQSRERRVLSDRDADAAISGRFAQRAAKHCRSPAAGAPPQMLGGLANITRDDVRRGRVALRHPADGRTSTPPRRAAIWARSPPTSSSVIDETAQGRAARARPSILRGQVADHEQRLLRAAVRPARRDRADLSADRGEFPVLDRSVRDHHRAAGGAGRHRLDAVRHPHHAVGAGADRRDHVHGRRHRQQRPGGQLRPRAAGAHRRRRSPRRSKPASPASGRC